MKTNQQPPASRRSFLGHLGVTAASAVGLAMVPSMARASGGEAPDTTSSGSYNCCVSTCRNCGPGLVAYYCSRLVSSCPPSYCTSCRSSAGTCYTQQGC